jgi:hypothetical protein
LLGPKSFSPKPISAGNGIYSSTTNTPLAVAVHLFRARFVSVAMDELVAL